MKREEFRASCGNGMWDCLLNAGEVFCWPCWVRELLGCVLEKVVVTQGRWTLQMAVRPDMWPSWRWERAAS